MDFTSILQTIPSRTSTALERSVVRLRSVSKIYVKHVITFSSPSIKSPFNAKIYVSCAEEARERDLTTECLGGLLHELSNDGAKRQFESFLENDIYSVLVESAQVRRFSLGSLDHGDHS